MNRVNKLNRFVKKNNDFIRLYTAGVKLLELDGSNRLNIPKDLMTYASLKNEIVLSSAVGMIEIWDKSIYEKSLPEYGRRLWPIGRRCYGQLK